MDAKTLESIPENVMAAAYKHVAAAKLKADGYHPGEVPYWYGWAVREAFCLGAKYQAEAATRERATKLRKKLELALEELNSLACWSEGKHVTGSFDNPDTAKSARETLARIAAIDAEG